VAALDDGRDLDDRYAVLRFGLPAYLPKIFAQGFDSSPPLMMSAGVKLKDVSSQLGGPRTHCS
jgi:hypothetical protein